MADQVSTLATALSASITAGTVTPAQLTGLSSAIVAGARALVASRLARRVGLLGAVSTPALLPAGVSLDEVAQTYDEVVEAGAFLNGAQNLDTQLNTLRSTDSTGQPLAGVIANVPAAAYPSWSTQLVNSAAAYEALEVEVLPA